MELASAGEQYLDKKDHFFSADAQTVFAAVSAWLLAISRFLTDAFLAFYPSLRPAG
jgi:hypothetical protein